MAENNNSKQGQKGHKKERLKEDESFSLIFVGKPRY